MNEDTSEVKWPCELNEQAIFDYVAEKLLWQNEKSFRPNLADFCAYRSSNGLKCAAGWMIPDEVYKRSMEGQAISAVLDPTTTGYVPALAPLRPFTALLEMLQAVHDDHLVNEWREKLRNVALKRNLNTNVLTKVQNEMHGEGR